MTDVGTLLKWHQHLFRVKAVRRPKHMGDLVTADSSGIGGGYIALSAVPVETPDSQCYAGTPVASGRVLSFHLRTRK